MVKKFLGCSALDTSAQELNCGRNEAQALLRLIEASPKVPRVPLLVDTQDAVEDEARYDRLEASIHPFTIVTE